MDRLTFEIPERDAANGIYAAMKAEVERRGSSVKLDDDIRSYIIDMAKWITDPTAPHGLLLNGLYGNGKTTLARALGMFIEFVTEHETSYSDRSVMCFRTAQKICQLCASGEKSKEQRTEYQKLLHEPMLIIDDLGDEPREVIVYGMVHKPIVDLLNERYDRRLMTIITTNLEPAEIRAIYGERVFDRMKEMFHTITFSNESFRRVKK